MKEEMQAILFGLGMLITFIAAICILKRSFDMTTSGAVACVIIGIGILFLIALLTVEYVAYRARKKQSGIEAKKVP